jgi:hypothetical protein
MKKARMKLYSMPTVTTAKIVMNKVVMIRSDHQLDSRCSAYLSFAEPLLFQNRRHPGYFSGDHLVRM